ncbi:YciI family protein [Cellulomonas xiejunii]|uniref:YciI family protein n=1 Tax=Cellulomonas xiejunii TaxID=2968083 RepID=A0ABY5KRS0_9CELL|nr:YciI family protein [Cellulomonas xiejunii]MCC2314951.1 YciI family protein [Cellulomonas xiejunii]MCC2321578.1 YciI family protein [Cellulomonas xiejunii]MCC2323270.1 YciI family protein [Cellulomonas xiejunii]UUI72146.1 YciI family protein [Cellulomonas xiejunii]
MKLVVLVYEDEETYRSADAAGRARYVRGHEEFARRAQAAGVTILAGEALTGVASARTVRHTGDVTDVTDGPFAETTEQLGGFYLVEAPDERTLVDLVRLLPETTHEIRECVEP